jgi:hypothetical protein
MFSLILHVRPIWDDIIAFAVIAASDLKSNHGSSPFQSFRPNFYSVFEKEGPVNSSDRDIILLLKQRMKRFLILTLIGFATLGAVSAGPVAEPLITPAPLVRRYDPGFVGWEDIGVTTTSCMSSQVNFYSSTLINDRRVFKHL